MIGLLRARFDEISAARAARDEEVVRGLLERWVSELEPAIAYRGGKIIGLTVADSLPGTYPFILEIEA